MNYIYLITIVEKRETGKRMINFVFNP